MHYFSTMLAVTALLGATSSAALAQTPPLTLSQAVTLGQQTAPALQGSMAGVRAADAGVAVARLRPNPTLTVEAENVLGSGRYAGFGGGDKTYSLEVPLELNGKRGARVQVAEAERAFAGVGVEAAKADVTLQITQVFIALAANERRLIAARTGVEFARQSAHAATERVRAGKASPIEAQRGQVMLLNAEVKAERIARAESSAAASLGRLLETTAPAHVDAPWFDDASAVDPNASDLLPLAVAAADAQIATARARLNVAQRARVPDVTVSAGMRRLGESRDTAAVLSLSVPLPFFNSGAASMDRTRAELDQAEAERRSVVRDARQAIATARADVADTFAAATAASGPVLAAASEAARIARLGYAEGKFSQLDLIDAERMLAETRETAIDALAAMHDARARLARLQGRITPLYKD